jgi:hypothetical protein
LLIEGTKTSSSKNGGGHTEAGFKEKEIMVQNKTSKTIKDEKTPDWNNS